MKIDQRLYEQFRDIGHDIFFSGLTSSHGGNMSVRIGNQLIIKRRGAQFGRLKMEDLIVTSLNDIDSEITRASTELIVHRRIYQKTSALAVIHSHPRTAVALSLSREAILPIDIEGSYLLHKVPVVASEYASGSPEMAELVADALREYKIIVLRAHGCFATGQTLEEAFHWISCLEEASDIILETHLLGEERIESRRHSESYAKW